MSKISFLEIIKEEFNVQLNPSELKSFIDKKNKKKFFVKWLTENQFMISLNFSFGTNYAFDIDYKSKSAICASVTMCELTENKTHIKIETKNKYGLLVILILPIIMMIFRFVFDLEIPLFSYFIPLIFFVFISSIFKSEEKRLIRYFKEYLSH